MASSAWPGPGHALEDAGEEGRTDAWIAQDEADENRFPGEGVRAGGGPDEGSGERGAGEEQRIHAWEDETGPAMSDGDYQGNGGSDYGSNEGEEEDEDVAELIRDFGHNPMMDRVQEVLYTSLVKRYENVTEEIRDMKSDVKNVKQKREQVGVELYGLQQQLARLQITLEESHMSHATHEEGRLNAEEQLGQVKQVFMDRRQKHDDLFQSYTKNKKELNAVQDTLRQVETYNEEMKNEILVTRRATYKAEEAVQMLEKSKVDQDLYIDRMQEQIRQLREEVAELDAQVEMQQGQGNDAEKMMRDTNQEMEVIQFEKKQLLQQWRSSLVGLQRRDEALTAANKALRDAEVSARDYDIEIEGIKRDIQKAQALNETLFSVRDRLENEGKHVNEQLQKIQEERQTLSERFQMLQRSVSQTEEEEKKAAVAEKNLQTQTQQLMQHIQTVTRERQKIEQEASLNAAQQATATQAVRSINKQTAEVVGQLHKLEMDAANVQNELARIQVDVINTQAHSVQLQDTKRGLNTELKDRDALIEKYQLEIRQRSDEIEKKMLRVDRLNRKYEKLMESAEEPESMGPLEATIRNVKKQIDAIQSESTRLKQEWLKSQTQLVHAAAEADEILERTVELRARSSILSQKKTRLLQEIGINTAEVKRLGGNIQTMHADMSRINGLINRNSSQAMELANTASLLERDFTQELKELEAESMQMEAKLLALKETKAAILDNILETERQIMLWEKKIQLERETQAALDPEEGKGEVQAMEKEIHRMELRHEMLKREQEQLIQEMERAIEKRDAVVLRQRGRSTSASANPARNTASRELTEQALRKRIAATKKQLLQTERELENCNSRIEDRQAQIHQLTADLEAASTEYETLTGNCDGIKGDIDRLISMKQQWATAVAIRTTMAKKIGAVQRGSMGATKEADGLEVEGSLMSAESKLSALADVISVVQRDFGHLGDVLERVKLLAQDHVSIPAQ